MNGPLTFVLDADLDLTVADAGRAGFLPTAAAPPRPRPTSRRSTPPPIT